MGFFDDLVLADEPVEARAVLATPRPPHPDDGRYTPPVDRYAPVRVPQAEPAGSGPETRVLLTGWSVWPRSVTLHLAVFRRTRRQDASVRRQSGLRVGLLLSDGRRVTSLDGTMTVQRYQAARSILLDHSRLALRTRVGDPPPGETELVLE
ncbi:hypothetical protein [Streptomyces sp. NPDC059597]|uniref:hypothetical protein n=1 Tax=Streptomyces sp. NPDC059597 TaxID=3346879 RepID=UPI00369B28F7